MNMEEQAVAQQKVDDPNLLKKDHDFVVPGDKIISSIEYIPGRNCFRDGDSIYSKRLGIVGVENHVISVVPLAGVYTPQMGDMIIGEVEDIHTAGWFIDLDTPGSAFLPLSGVRGFIRSGTDLSKIYNVGDLIYSKVVSCTRQGINVSMQDPRARKLFGGKVINISPVKVPRLIGRQGSMISMIKRMTGCNVIVGQNGVVWMNGEKDALVTEVVDKIDREAHIEGLTDRIEKFIQNKLPKGFVPQPQEEEAPAESSGNFSDFQAKREDQGAGDGG